MWERSSEADKTRQSNKLNIWIWALALAMRWPEWQCKFTVSWLIFAFDKTPQLRPLFPSPQLGKTCTFNMSRANHSCAGPFSECFLSILLYQALNVRINSWTFCNPSHTLPLSLCHSFCRKDYLLHFMMKIIRLLHTYSKEQAVPFYSSCPTTRGHCRTVKRYQTLRNILHSGRRLSSAPPSLPADKIRHRLPPGGRLKNCICSPP